MKLPPTAPSHQTLLRTAHVARRRSIRYPWIRDSRVKTPFRTAISHAIRFWLVVICARKNATPVHARLVPSTSTLPADVAGQWPSQPAIKETSSTRTVSASAELSSTVGAMSAESVVALARRRRLSGGSRNGLPTRITSQSISACRYAVASSNVASTRASSYATKGHACRAWRPSLRRSAAPVDGRFSSRRNHVGHDHQSVDSPARGLVRVATRRFHTNATPMIRPAQSAPS